MNLFYDSNTNAIKPSNIAAFTGGTEHVQLSRSRIHPNPVDSESVLICASDDASCGVKIWDRNSKFVQQIRTYQPIFDYEFIKINDNTSALCCLADKEIRMYKIF